MPKQIKIWVAMDKKGLVEGGCTQDDLDDRLMDEKGYCHPKWNEDGICINAGSCGCTDDTCHRYPAEVIVTGKAQ